MQTFYKKRPSAAAAPVLTTKRACGSTVASREHKCAVIVQRAWKRTLCLKLTYRVTGAFMNTGPTVNHVKSIRYAFNINSNYKL